MLSLVQWTNKPVNVRPCDKSHLIMHQLLWKPAGTIFFLGKSKKGGRNKVIQGELGEWLGTRLIRVFNIKS